MVEYIAKGDNRFRCLAMLPLIELVSVRKLRCKKTGKRKIENQFNYDPTNYQLFPNAPLQTFSQDEQLDNRTGSRRWNTGPYEILAVGTDDIREFCKLRFIPSVLECKTSKLFDNEKVKHGQVPRIYFILFWQRQRPHTAKNNKIIRILFQ